MSDIVQIKSDKDIDEMFKRIQRIPLGEGPITKKDISFYIHYYGDHCPGIKDESPAGIPTFQAWTEAKEKVLRRLSTKDMKGFQEAIDRYHKASKAGADNTENRKVLTEYYKKILTCTHEEQKAIADLKRKENYPTGTRVRIGQDKGEIVYVQDDGLGYAVMLDKVRKTHKHVRPMQAYSKDQIMILCAGCDNVDGKFACSRCHVVYYCGKDCQKKAWAAHKKKCGKDKSGNGFTKMAPVRIDFPNGMPMPH